MEKTAVFYQGADKRPTDCGPEHRLFTEIREIEIAHLELRYAHTRVKRPVSSLTDSIKRFGQMVPVVTVKEGEGCFVLIDGYLRVTALRGCGRDTVMAEIWPLREEEALARSLLLSQERKWEPIEQALVIRELSMRHRLSQGEAARLMGRDQSWISRRLALVEALPEEVLGLVRKGRLSTWSATRVLVPMARAIPDHAKTLAETLLKEPLSTRSLSDFFHHYQKANRTQRERMVAEPRLFLKALHHREEDSKACLLKEGPEGRWLKDIKVVAHILRRLIKELPTVIYPGQPSGERQRLLTAFEETKAVMVCLSQKIRRLG